MPALRLRAQADSRGGAGQEERTEERAHAASEAADAGADPEPARARRAADPPQPLPTSYDSISPGDS